MIIFTLVETAWWGPAVYGPIGRAVKCGVDTNVVSAECDPITVFWGRALSWIHGTALSQAVTIQRVYTSSNGLANSRILCIFQCV